MRSALRSEHKATNSFPLYHLIYFPLAHFKQIYGQAANIHLRDMQTKDLSPRREDADGKRFGKTAFALRTSDSRQNGRCHHGNQHFGQTAAMGNAPGTNGSGTKNKHKVFIRRTFRRKVSLP